MVKKKIQIGAWLTSQEIRYLSKYAVERHIDNDALGSLLLVRELNLKRLHKLKIKYSRTVSSADRKRFTVHSKNTDFKEKILSHFFAHNMNANMAFGLILRAELDERWLEEACKII